MNDKSNEVINYVSTLTGEIQKNPLIQLEYGMALYERGNKDEALSVFTSIHNGDPTLDWVIEAGNYIQSIEAQKSQSGMVQP